MKKRDIILIIVGSVFLLAILLPWQDWLGGLSNKKTKTVSGSAITVSGTSIDTSGKTPLDQTVMELTQNHYINEKSIVNPPFYENNIDDKEFDKRRDTTQLMNNIHIQAVFLASKQAVYRVMNCNDIGLLNVTIQVQNKNKEGELFSDVKNTISYLPAGDSTFIKIENLSTEDSFLDSTCIPTIILDETDNAISNMTSISKLNISLSQTDGLSYQITSKENNVSVSFDVVFVSEGKINNVLSLQEISLEKGENSESGYFMDEIPDPSTYQEYYIRYRVRKS